VSDSQHDPPTAAWGFGLATFAGTRDGSGGAVLDTWYPAPRLGSPEGESRDDQDSPGGDPAEETRALLSKLEGIDEHVTFPLPRGIGQAAG